MKRDMDLVRQILLDIEDGKTSFVTNILESESDQEFEEISKTKRHLEIMSSAGLIESLLDPIDSRTKVMGITWSGYDFLDTIRDPAIWRRTKEGASKAGGAGFGFIVELGKAYAKAELQKLGLPIG